MSTSAMTQATALPLSGEPRGSRGLALLLSLVAGLLALPAATASAESLPPFTARGVDPARRTVTFVFNGGPGAAPLAGQSAAVPPPVEQLTADCAVPVYATDQLVCGDPALKALDAELAAALAGFVAPASAWFEPQEEWFKRRSRCAFAEDHYACATAAYRERLALMQPPGPAIDRIAVACTDPAITTVAVSGEWTILIGSDGRTVGIAAPAAAKASWQPFLRGAKRGARLRLQALQGGKLDCRMNPRQPR